MLRNIAKCCDLAFLGPYELGTRLAIEVKFLDSLLDHLVEHVLALLNSSIPGLRCIMELPLDGLERES